jgi:hypothetical protein
MKYNHSGFRVLTRGYKRGQVAIEYKRGQVAMARS